MSTDVYIWDILLYLHAYISLFTSIAQSLNYLTSSAAVKSMLSVYNTLQKSMRV